MASLHVVDANGVEHTIEAEANGESIMSILLNRSFDVGLCGGNCACGTCCAAIAPEWAVHLNPPDSGESGLVEHASPGVGTARLTCQLPFDEKLDGIRLRLIPIE